MATIIGKLCELHPELGGQRVASNGRCRSCWRAYRREYQRTHRRGERIGKVCERHPELKGQRRNDNCPGCERERHSDPEARKRWRAQRDPVKRRAKLLRWRAANWDRYLAGASARSAVRRARKKEATGDSPAQRRAWAAMSRKARRLGMTIDHIVPIAGCRVCGEKGVHRRSNWQLLTPSDNASKGNRCMDCWVRLVV